MLPDRLRNLRIGVEKTQKEMASHLGITRQGYGNYEVGNTEPDQKTVNFLANFFNVSIDYLYGRSDIQSADLNSQIINTANKNKHNKGVSVKKVDQMTIVGRAFFGGDDKYTREELNIARAVAKAAIDAYRKTTNKK